MLDGPGLASAFVKCDISHVIWIPDSTTGAWNDELSSHRGFQLIRPCREGEGIAIAAGLLLGGASPIVIIQCTGFFEAGDALRNVVHDLRLPLFLLIGLRNYYRHEEGKTSDSCPVYAESILTAWNVPFQIVGRDADATEIEKAYVTARDTGRAAAVFIAE